MGRPSILSDPMREEILRRLTAGESPREVSKATGVAYTTIRRNFSAHVPKAQELARTLARAEIELAHLPVSAQRAVRDVTNRLKEIELDYASVAAKGARHADMIADIAGRAIAGEDVDPAQIKGAMLAEALHKAANVALEPAKAMLTSRKGPSEDQEERPIHTPEQLRKMAELQERRK